MKNINEIKTLIDIDLQRKAVLGDLAERGASQNLGISNFKLFSIIQNIWHSFNLHTVLYFICWP